MIIKNALLEEIVGGFAVLEPDFTEIKQLFQEKPLFHKGYYDDSQLAHCISELILRHSIKKISSEYPRRVIFDPIRSGSLTDNYRFRLNHLTENIDVYQRIENGFELIGDFDLLTKIDGLVTLWEIKLSKYRSRGRISSVGISKKTNKQIRRKNYGDRVSRPSSMGTSYAMAPERIDQLTKPLLEYFKADHCGYALVLSSDQINLEDYRQKEFIKNNGLLVPFYTDRHTFRNDIQIFRELGVLSGVMK